MTRNELAFNDIGAGKTMISYVHVQPGRCHRCSLYFAKRILHVIVYDIRQLQTIN